MEKWLRRQTGLKCAGIDVSIAETHNETSFALKANRPTVNLQPPTLFSLFGRGHDIAQRSPGRTRSSEWREGEILIAVGGTDGRIVMLALNEPQRCSRGSDQSVGGPSSAHLAKRRDRAAHGDVPPQGIGALRGGTLDVLLELGLEITG